MANVQELLRAVADAKEEMKSAKEALNDALEATDVYRAAYEAAMTAPDVSEKDAEKHALVVALKHFSKKLA
jgi:hypothetical protein